jgi:hypothetical protein
MKLPLTFAAAFIAALTVALGLGRLTAAPTSSASRDRTALLKLPRATPAGQDVFYGHIKTLTKRGNRFELRFDPAWLLQGRTAELAAVADKVLRPGEPVPNDNYTRDETHRLLTFFVPPSARATVLTKGLQQATVGPAELAEIIQGKNPKHRPLFALGNGFGFWIRVSSDTVLSLDQQYHP